MRTTFVKHVRKSGFSKKYLLSLLVAVLLCGCDTAESISENKTDSPSPAFQTVITENISSETVSSEATAASETLPVTSEEIITDETTEVRASAETEQSISAADNDAEEDDTSAAVQTTVPQTEVPEETTAGTDADVITFTGILIDEDCSDFEDPPSHDLPCMLMDECRASGYGIDILQDDGTWKFYMFDEKGQDLSWEYLIHTSRMDKLYVNVTGTLKDGKIYVDKLEEI